MTDKAETNGFKMEMAMNPAAPRGLPKLLQLNRFVNRPLAALLVRAVRRTSLQPNHLTAAGFALSAAGALFFLGGNHRSFIIAGLFIYAGTILDGADGMLARSKNLCTRFGAYLDLFLDRLTDFLVLGAMVTGYYIESGRLGLFILSLFGLAAYMLQMALYYLEREYRGQRSGPGANGDFRGIVYLGVFIFALINRLDVLIVLLLCIPVPNIIYRLIRLWVLERPADPTP